MDSAFRRDIEGLRAVAVLAVVLYHAGVLRGGYVGVDVFFVLSGFLITRLLWREIAGTGRVGFASFYGRRARRLLPASALVLVVTAIASVTILTPLEARTVLGDTKAAALYVANYRFIAQHTTYLGPHGPSPLQHYWSLGVEEQFYLVWPVLILGLATVARRRPGRVAAGLGFVAFVSLITSIHLTNVNQPWAFFSLPTRAWELAAGSLVAFAAPRLTRLRACVAASLGWLGLAAIVLAFVHFGASTAFPGVAALVPVVGTAALLVCGCAVPPRGPRIVLEPAPMQLVGRCSYAWYLWHWPVLVLAPVAVGHPLATWQNIVLSGGSGVLAYGTVVLVERPVRFSRALATPPRRSLALGAALTAAALVVSASSAARLPSLRGTGIAATLHPRIAALAPVHAVTHRSVDASATEIAAAPIIAAVDAATGARPVPANLEPPLARAASDKAQPFLDGCDNTYTDAEVHRCAYADTTAPTTIVVFGDSHATQYYPALDAIAQFRHWRLVVLTKATCPPFEIQLFSPVLGRNFRECEQWREAAFQRIAHEHAAVVILGVARHYGPEYHFQVFSPAWLDGMRTTIRRIRADGSRVIVLGPTPKPAFDVPSCLSGSLGDAAACNTPRDRAVNATGRAFEDDTAVAAGARYVDVAPWMCTATECPPVVGNLLVYRDDNHLTIAYTQWIAPALAAEIDATMAARP